MRRLITTPKMEVLWINAVWMWRLRVLSSVVLGAVSVALLMLSLARLLGVDVVNWPAVALWLIQSYGSAVLWLLFTVADLVQALGLVRLAEWVRAIPVWLFDLAAVWVFVGGLVRLSEIFMLLRGEKGTLNRGPDFITDDWAQITWRQRRALAWEVTKKYVLWPPRVLSDIREGQWKLSPAIGGGLFVLTLSLLGLAVWVFPAGSRLSHQTGCGFELC